MLITADFVLLNFPKTGTSFARMALKQIYKQRQGIFGRLLQSLKLKQPPARELYFVKPNQKVHHGVAAQHGNYSQIPKEYLDRQIVSIMRNPLARYTSGYFYRWWAKHPPGDISRIREKYPHFPDLSFAEYYAMSHEFSRDNNALYAQDHGDIGTNTLRFIQFYFPDPASLLNQMKSGDWKMAEIKRQMPDIYFLHQESLREDLKQLLREKKFADHEIKIIDLLEDQNVSKKSTESSDPLKIIDDTTLHDILRRDRLLFELFPNYLPS